MNSLDAEIALYLEKHRGQWSDASYRGVSAHFNTLSAIGLDSPERLHTELVNRRLSNYTIKVYFDLACRFEKTIRGTETFKEWMQSNRNLFKNAYKKKNKLMTEEHFQAFLATAPTDSIYNFLILTGRAGLRKSEAFAARWEHIKNNLLEVPNGKGGKQRFVPFDRAWLKNPKDIGSIVKQFRPDGRFDDFTPHDFRAFYATTIVNCPGMSIEDARDLLGHEDIKTTAKYLRANKDKQARLIKEMFG